MSIPKFQSVFSRATTQQSDLQAILSQKFIHNRHYISGQRNTGLQIELEIIVNERYILPC